MSNDLLYFDLNTGGRIPSIGLGTWQSPLGEVYNGVITAIKAGYRHIDCARNYDNEEEGWSSNFYEVYDILQDATQHKGRRNGPIDLRRRLLTGYSLVYETNSPYKSIEVVWDDDNF